MQWRLDFRKIFGAAADGLFAMALTQTSTFEGAARPILHGHAGGDIARAQELALQGLQAYLHVIKRHSDRFLVGYSDEVSYEDLRVPVARRWTTPIGTAPGVDPHADGLEPLSYLFGFQMPGPVSHVPQQPAHMPFQEDPRREDLFIPPTFASRGLAYFSERLRAYRQRRGTAIVLPALAGTCHSAAGVSPLLTEIETMVKTLAPHADGFVWLPMLAGWSGLGHPDCFRRAAEALRTHAGDRPVLVEMPAMDGEICSDRWLELVGAFVDGGGSGIVAVGGRAVPGAQTPAPAGWPFPSAIRCGASLAACRQAAIEAARRAFPRLLIAACGGFHHRDEALRACEYANVIVENEAYTRFGPGIAVQLLHQLVLRLRYLERTGKIESTELWAFQQARWKQLAASPHTS